MSVIVGDEIALLFQEKFCLSAQPPEFVGYGFDEAFTNMRYEGEDSKLMLPPQSYPSRAVR